MLWREAIGRVGASRVCLDDFAESVLVASRASFLLLTTCFPLPTCRSLLDLLLLDSLWQWKRRKNRSFFFWWIGLPNNLGSGFTCFFYPDITLQRSIRWGVFLLTKLLYKHISCFSYFEGHFDISPFLH
jgi:hypothetical protein